jgi:hypothetical protein
MRPYELGDLGGHSSFLVGAAKGSKLGPYAFRFCSAHRPSVPVPEFVLNKLSVQCTGKAPGDLVFPGSEGGYLPRPKSSNGWFTRAVKAAMVQAITPHDLRHTCASLAVAAGVHISAGGGTRTLLAPKVRAPEWL